MNDFLPKDYEIPASPSNYMRFQKGLNRIRILSSAITGYEYFTTENKPIRSKEPFEELPSDIKKDGKVKAFWAFPVYNYQTKQIQILELTQKSIMHSIKSLVDNSKWGDPKKYDIAVTKTGEGLDTEYDTQGEPPIADTDPKIVTQYNAMSINLEALYTGDDPFSGNKDVTNDEPNF